jgi:hypothetical protein
LKCTEYILLIFSYFPVSGFWEKSLYKSRLLRISSEKVSLNFLLGEPSDIRPAILPHISSNVFETCFRNVFLDNQRTVYYCLYLILLLFVYVWLKYYRKYYCILSSIKLLIFHCPCSTHFRVLYCTCRNCHDAHTVHILAYSFYLKIIIVSFLKLVIQICVLFY